MHTLYEHTVSFRCFTPFVAKAFFACWFVLPMVFIMRNQNEIYSKINQSVQMRRKFLLVGVDTMECVLSTSWNRCQTYFKFLLRKSRLITQHISKKFRCKKYSIFRSDKIFFAFTNNSQNEFKVKTLSSFRRM